MLQIFYGNGKGKTCAAVGSAVRASGQNFHVLFISFFKDGSSGEVSVLKRIDNIEFVTVANDFSLFEYPDKERFDKLSSSCIDAFNNINNEVKDFDMIVLDEALDAVNYKYLNKDILLSFLCNNKCKKEIIITGHKLTPELTDLADYISEIKSIKHPYEKGIKARKGIEF